MNVPTAWCACSIFGILALLLPALSPANAPTAQGKSLYILYRCPSPKVLYTNAITAQDARARHCQYVEINPRWVEVSSDDDASAYIDKQTIKRHGHNVEAWLEIIYTEPTATTDRYPARQYQNETDLAVYNCAERTSATIEILRYANADKSGEVVETWSIPKSMAAFSGVAPQTIGERAFTYLCNNDHHKAGST
jgi:hypothetical protein